MTDDLLPAALRETFLEAHRTKLPLFKRLLTENLGATKEHLLIISDTGTKSSHVAPMLNTLYKAAADELGLTTSVVTQSVILRGATAEQQVIDAMESLPENSLIMLNVSGRIGNLTSLGKSYRLFCHERGHRFFSSSNLGLLPDEKFWNLIEALDVDFHAMQEEGALLKQKLDAAKEVRITTPAGTDVTFNKEGMTAINNDGFYTERGHGGNMPAGEVYFPPTKTGVNGTIVIDGSYRTKDASIVPDNPIIMTIKEGKIIGMNKTPEAEALEATLRWAEEHAQHPWGIRYIGECGIGLNPGAKLVGCTILDEKVRGTVHIANGSNKWFGGKIAAIIHLDHVMKNPTIYLDGERLPIDF